MKKFIAATLIIGLIFNTTVLSCQGMNDPFAPNSAPVTPVKTSRSASVTSSPSGSVASEDSVDDKAALENAKKRIARFEIQVKENNRLLGEVFNVLGSWRKDPVLDEAIAHHPWKNLIKGKIGSQHLSELLQIVSTHFERKGEELRTRLGGLVSGKQDAAASSAETALEPVLAGPLGDAEQEMRKIRQELAELESLKEELRVATQAQERLTKEKSVLEEAKEQQARELERLRKELEDERKARASTAASSSGVVVTKDTSSGYTSRDLICAGVGAAATLLGVFLWSYMRSVPAAAGVPSDL